MHFLRRSHHPAAAPTLAAPNAPVAIAVAAAAASYGAGAAAVALSGGIIAAGSFGAVMIGTLAPLAVSPVAREGSVAE